MSDTYADNALNRKLDRVGLKKGTAVVCSSSSGSDRTSSNRSDRGYASNSPRGSSSSKSSKGDGKTNGVYADTPKNRELKRVGLPHGTCPNSSKTSSATVKKSSGASTSSKGTSKAERVYADTPYNQKLGRVGLPWGSVVVKSSGNIVTSGGTPIRRYVDNPLNRQMGRVGKVIVKHPVTSRPAGGQTYNAYKPLVRIDPEDDNLGLILDQLFKLRSEVRTTKDTKRKEQCQRAIGIVYRHEASLTKYSSGMKVPDWVRGGQIIRYEELTLGESLGQGGFGEVFAAIWKDNEQVAVKKLKVQSVSRAKQEEFQSEVKVFSDLNHPAIVQFYGVSIKSPNLAIVMEFMGGGSMYDILHVEERNLNGYHKKQMITDCLEALEYLHKKNVSHRDIKSMNILICDDYSHCKLGDFGLALTEVAKVTSSAAGYDPVGTLIYSAPEVLEQSRLNLDELKCADIYSMGIVLVEFLTENEPFKGMRGGPIKDAVLNGYRPDTRRICDDYLRRIVESTIAKEPRHRPSASRLLKDWKGLNSPASTITSLVSSLDIHDTDTSRDTRASEEYRKAGLYRLPKPVSRL